MVREAGEQEKTRFLFGKGSFLGLRGSEEVRLKKAGSFGAPQTLIPTPISCGFSAPQGPEQLRPPAPAALVPSTGPILPGGEGLASPCSPLPIQTAVFVLVCPPRRGGG